MRVTAKGSGRMVGMASCPVGMGKLRRGRLLAPQESCAGAQDEEPQGHHIPQHLPQDPSKPALVPIDAGQHSPTMLNQANVCK